MKRMKNAGGRKQFAGGRQNRKRSRLNDRGNEAWRARSARRHAAYGSVYVFNTWTWWVSWAHTRDC